MAKTTKAKAKATDSQPQKTQEGAKGSAELGLGAPGGVVMVEVGSLRAHPQNPRVHGLHRDSVAELAASMRAHGMLQAIVARPHPEERGGGVLQVVAGHRRLAAARVAELSHVPVSVRELDDRAALEIMAMENMQRVDLHPLEEGRAGARLQSGGGAREETAAHLGKSAKWVARRGAIARLSEGWQREVEDPGSAFARWSAASLELIAPLPVAMQDGLLAGWKGRCKTEQGAAWVAGLTSAHVRAEIAESLMVIRTAPWDPGDALLDRTAGACTKCPKRSDREPDLFEELHGAVPVAGCAWCLDAACWNGKLDALVRRSERFAREAGGQTLLVRGAGDYGNGRLVGVSEERKGEVRHGYGLTPAKEGDAGAVRALVVTGPEAGKVEWVKVPEAPKREGVKREMTEEEKRAAVEWERKRLLKARVAEVLRRPELTDDLCKDASAMLRGVMLGYMAAPELDEDDEPSRSSEDVWEERLLGMDLRGLERELARRLVGDVRCDLEMEHTQLNDSLLGQVRRLGVDVRALTAQVERELPMPGEVVEPVAPVAAAPEEAEPAKGEKLRGLDRAREQGREAAAAGKQRDWNPFIKRGFKLAWYEGFDAVVAEKDARAEVGADG